MTRALERLVLPFLMIEWVNNDLLAILIDHMLNKNANARNGKKWKSIILQRASMMIPAPNH